MTSDGAQPDPAYRRKHVAESKDAALLHWEPCGVPNEMAFLRPMTEYVLPSIAALRLTEADYARLAIPVLLIHGRRDRGAPYGGARDWARRLEGAERVSSFE